jgi:CDP-diacylglycerol pyrophosphatase
VHSNVRLKHGDDFIDCVSSTPPGDELLLKKVYGLAGGESPKSDTPSSRNFLLPAFRRFFFIIDKV